jgi:hypothetical protein
VFKEKGWELFGVTFRELEVHDNVKPFTIGFILKK